MCWWPSDFTFMCTKISNNKMMILLVTMMLSRYALDCVHTHGSSESALMLVAMGYLYLAALLTRGLGRSPNTPVFCTLSARALIELAMSPVPSSISCQREREKGIERKKDREREGGREGGREG